MRLYKSREIIYHNKSEMTEKCENLIKHNDQQYHNHRRAQFPVRRFKLSQENRRDRICMYCFTNVIIENYE